MSKITNDGLTRSDTEFFITVCPYGNSGRQRVNLVFAVIFRQLCQTCLRAGRQSRCFFSYRARRNDAKRNNDTVRNTQRHFRHLVSNCLLVSFVFVYLSSHSQLAVAISAIFVWQHASWSSALVCILEWDPISWLRGGRRGSAMVLFERALVVSYMLPIVTIALSLTSRPQFAVECLRRSNQQGVGQFEAKFGEEGVDRCKPNLNKNLEWHGAVVCKRNHVDIFCRLSTIHERDRQTNIQTTER